MFDGSTPPLPGERQLRQFQIQVLNSRWAWVDPAWWHFDLCSPFWRLYRHEQRGVVIRCGGRSLALDPGTTWVIPAWLEFQAETSARVQQRYLHFSLAGLPPGLHRRLFAAPVALTQDPLLEALAERWQSSLVDTTPSVLFGAPAPPPGRPPSLADFTWAGVLAQAAFARVVEGLPEPVTALCQALLGDDGIRPALDAIESSLAEPPGNEALAALCGVSSNQLIRLFRSAVGMTPARYGLERRVAIAAQELACSSRSLEDIAESLGFVDRYHLSRVFSRHLGITPAAYRRGHEVTSDGDQGHRTSLTKGLIPG